MAKVSVDQNKCIGCEACVALCPDIFKMKDGKSTVIKSRLDDPACAKNAASSCPAGAIKVA